MALRIILTLLMTAVTAAIAGRRIFWLVRLIRSGTAAPGRGKDAPGRVVNDAEEVLGQTRLLKWSVPGLAHFFTFWGFVILNLTILEAYGALLIDRDFSIPLVGKWQALGFVEDLMAVAVLAGLATFAVLRLRNAPQRKQRDSRFYGSHTGPAWVILGMISLVIVTLLLLRGAQLNAGEFPYGRSKWTFASYLVAKALGTGDYNRGLATLFLLLQVAVVLVFLIIVTYSKHLHIATAPINVYFKRLPKALGALPPVTDAHGKTIDFMDVENLSEDTVFGKGKVEDFSWKAYLDFATCTECGRCQSQCPAWNTGKPLSPKLVIMDLRDHLFAKAPYLIGGKTVPDDAVPDFTTPAAEGGSHGTHVPEAGYPRVEGTNIEQASRPLVGDLASHGVIDPDVLWSCTTCGACVEQCPVDIEHIDHIVDMRRYQVLIESSFPSEAGSMLRNLENKGNPWGLPVRNREEWTEGLGFEVRRVSPGQPL
ncbi:MAG TPA: (Fe-S)-binding protein, partial [Jatrophihabitans sp.]|nr:(Fe-S)-binding protein [Jatrophihabitans sp.]